MRRPKLIHLLLLLAASAAAGHAVEPAPASGSRTGGASVAPIKKFSLPKFTPKGSRSMLIRGEEARLLDNDRIAILGMDLSVYNEHDPRTLEARLSSSAAEWDNKTQTASGSDGFQLKRNDVEMSGLRWTYLHNPSQAGRKVVIEGKVHVIFQAQLGNILK